MSLQKSRREIIRARDLLHTAVRRQQPRSHKTIQKALAHLYDATHEMLEAKRPEPEVILGLFSASEVLYRAAIAKDKRGRLHEQWLAWRVLENALRDW